MKIGLQATRIAIAGFVVPFMAVYAPALMLQGGDSGRDPAYVVVKAVVAIMLWGGTAIGFGLAPVSWPERIIAFLSAALLIAALPLTDGGRHRHGCRPDHLARIPGPRKAALANRGSVTIARRMIAAALCIAVGARIVSLPIHSFTLESMHTVKKVRWEEDYLIAGDWMLLTAPSVDQEPAWSHHPTPCATERCGATDRRIDGESRCFWRARRSEKTTVCASTASAGRSTSSCRGEARQHWPRARPRNPLSAQHPLETEDQRDARACGSGNRHNSASFHPRAALPRRRTSRAGIGR